LGHRRYNSTIRSLFFVANGSTNRFIATLTTVLYLPTTLYLSVRRYLFLLLLEALKIATPSKQPNKPWDTFSTWL
jgi:hypothetical protein